MSSATLSVKTNSRPHSRLAVEIEIPAERCKNSYDEAVTRLSRSVSIPGFRKGKVPKTVILQQLGTERIQATAIEKLIQKVWEEALAQEEIEPLCEPELIEGFEVLLENFNPEKVLKLTLETDIAPTPTLKRTKGLTAEAETVLFNPEKINELIEESRKQLATLIPINNRSAEKGDTALISFKGIFTDDGSSIEGGSSDSMDIEIEPGKMIPGFIEGLIGMELNQEKVLKCKFPDEYHQEEARGREAEFKVILKDLKTKELPKLDDDFAKQASDKETMAELRSELEERLKADAKRRNQKNRQDSLLISLTKELEVELPKTLIEQEVRVIVEQTAQNFAQQGIDVKSMFTPEIVKSLMESSRDEAKEQLKQKLALQALAKEEEIKVSEEEIKLKTSEIQSELAEEKNIDQTRLKEVITDDLLKEKLLKWLEENNTVVEKVPEKKNQNNTQTKSQKPNKEKTQNKKNKEPKSSSKSPKS